MLLATLTRPLTYPEILANMVKAVDHMNRPFTKQESWYNALIFVTGPMTVYYHIDDVPLEVRKHYKDVIVKNYVAIINDHFD